MRCSRAVIPQAKALDFVEAPPSRKRAGASPLSVKETLYSPPPLAFNKRRVTAIEPIGIVDKAWSLERGVERGVERGGRRGE